jgi:hypothetical protein
MASERQKQIVLVILVLVLAGAIYRALGPQDQTAIVTSNSSGGSNRQAGTASRAIEAPDVRLEALEHERIKPTAGERNLFRFRAASTEAPVRAPGPATLPTPPPLPAGPPPPPALAPITLKFIGVVEATEKSQTYAVLRDDRGVYHGREGDIIEGRYRILRIGAESVDLAYVDGRGRQTIRLGS